MILGIPILILVTVILLGFIYIKTKSWKKIGYSLEIIISLVVFVLSAKLPYLTTADKSLFAIIILLGVGLLVNGIVSFLKK